MSETVRFGRFSLISRVLAAMFALGVVMYGVALGVLGQSLVERAQGQLRQGAERELSALQTAIQGLAVQRDYPAIEQTIRERVARAQLLEARFVSGRMRIEASTPPRLPGYPAWFGALVESKRQAAHTQADLVIGGVQYGTLSVTLDPAPVMHNLWGMGLRFTQLAAGSLLVVLVLMYWMLRLSLRGLHELRQAVRSIESGDFGARARLVSGSAPEVRETKLAFNHMADHVGRLVAALERKQAELSVEKERLRVTFESIGDAVLVTDARGQIEFLNPKAEELTGFSNEQARGRRVSDVLPLIDETSGEPVPNPLETALACNMAVALDNHTLMRRYNASPLAISDTAAPIHAADGRIEGGVLVFQDESERRSLLKRLAWQAERDPLTGLFNRRAMESRLTDALDSVRRAPRAFVFCYVDLDRFKLVNDTCGHRAGDVLLQRLSAIMARRVEGEEHYLARLGGDEFGLLFVDTGLPEALNHVQALRDEIGRFRFEWEGKVFRLGVSFGVTELHAGMGDVGDILSEADTACYHAKSLGGNRSVNNLLLMHMERHEAWHKVFGLMTAEEAVALLQRAVQMKKNQKTS